MAIAKTKMLINKKNGYFFYYEDYDDNGNLTDKGFHFYDKFVDDLVVSSNDGVYIDSVGTYTKDSNGNKVYHNMEINTNNRFIYIDSDGNELSSYSDIVITIDLNSTILNLSLNDTNFPNGVYEDDNNNYYIKLDLVGSKTLTFKSKADGYKLIDFSIPYTRELFNLLNINFSYDNILEKIDTYFAKEPYKISHIDNEFNNLNTNINTYYLDIDSRFDNVDNVNNTISTKIDTLSTNLYDYKSDIILEIDNKSDNIVDKINDLQSSFNELKISFVSLNGSSGAKYKDNSIVKIKDYNGNWKTEASVIYKTERGLLNIAYLVVGLDDVNKNDSMLVTENLISEYVGQFAGSSYDTSSSTESSISTDTSTQQ